MTRAMRTTVLTIDHDTAAEYYKILVDGLKIATSKPLLHLREWKEEVLNSFRKELKCLDVSQCVDQA